MKYGSQLAEQLNVHHGGYAHFGCKLRATATDHSGKVFGLLSRERQTGRTSLDFWLCELGRQGRSSLAWRHLRRWCCRSRMGTMPGGSLGAGCSVWSCSRCRQTRVFDQGELGSVDLQVDLIADVGDAGNASFCMTADSRGGAWIFIDSADVDDPVCWYIGDQETATEFPLVAHIHCVSTAYAVSLSEIYIQFGYEDRKHGMLAREAAALKFTEWPNQLSDDDRHCFDQDFNGRLLRLGDRLVGLADNGLWTVRIPSAPNSDHLWEKVFDLPAHETAAFRVLGAGAEKDQVVICCVAKLDGVLQPAHFLLPTHVVQVKAAANPSSLGTGSNRTICTARPLSSLVVVPVHGETLYQRSVPTTDAASFRSWNCNILPLAVRELTATDGHSCLGRSLLLFDLSGYAYRIWDDEILRASAGWRPPTCSFDASRDEVTFSFQQSDHQDPKLKCAVEPLLRYEYFRALFSGWQEGRAHEVLLDGVELSSFREILRFVHTGEIVSAPLGETLNLLRIANKYMIEDLVAILVRSLRLAVAQVHTAEKDEVLGLLLSTEAVGDYGAGLLQDVVAAIIDRRQPLLKDASFMMELGSRSGVVFEALMAVVIDDFNAASRPSRIKKWLAKTVAPSWSVFTQQNVDCACGEEASSGRRTRSRSPLRCRQG